MVCLPEYKAGRAEVCEIDRVRDAAPGREYFVRLPDGYLLACGIDRARADLVSESLNVMLKWIDFYPPVGVLESIVRQSFASEDRWSREASAVVPHSRDVSGTEEVSKKGQVLSESGTESRPTVNMLCTCQDQHRRGYCQEPNCPNNMFATLSAIPQKDETP